MKKEGEGEREREREGVRAEGREEMGPVPCGGLADTVKGEKLRKRET